MQTWHHENVTCKTFTNISSSFFLSRVYYLVSLFLDHPAQLSLSLIIRWPCYNQVLTQRTTLSASLTSWITFSYCKLWNISVCMWCSDLFSKKDIVYVESACDHEKNCALFLLVHWLFQNKYYFYYSRGMGKLFILLHFILNITLHADKPVTTKPSDIISGNVLFNRMHFFFLYNREDTFHCIL